MFTLFLVLMILTGFQMLVSFILTALIFGALTLPRIPSVILGIIAEIMIIYIGASTMSTWVGATMPILAIIWPCCLIYVLILKWE